MLNISNGMSFRCAIACASLMLGCFGQWSLAGSVGPRAQPLRPVACSLEHGRDPVRHSLRQNQWRGQYRLHFDQGELISAPTTLLVVDIVCAGNVSTPSSPSSFLPNMVFRLSRATPALVPPPPLNVFRACYTQTKNLTPRDCHAKGLIRSKTILASSFADRYAKE